MLKVLLLSLSRQYTVDGQYIPSLFIEPEVRHDKTSYRDEGVKRECCMYLIETPINAFANRADPDQAALV